MIASPDTLRTFPPLAILSEEEVAQMACHLQPLKVKAETVICEENSDGNCCYFLLQGSIQICKQLSDGRSVRLATLEAGEMIGQTGLIPEQRRTAQMYAQTDATLLVLQRSTLEDALYHAESWACQVFRMVASTLACQLRSALQRLDDIETTVYRGRDIERRTSTEPIALHEPFSLSPQPSTNKLSHFSQPKRTTHSQESKL